MNDIKIKDSARLIGKMRFGENIYISQGTVVRSSDDSVTISNNSLVLENSVIIGTSEYPVKVGRKTVFGHKCICIGAEIGDLCEIGNCTIFLPGSKVGDMCIFGEGTIIPENAVIPDGSVVVGRPGRIIRTINDEDKNMILKMRGNNITLINFDENILEYEIKEKKDMGKLYSNNGKNPIIAESTFLFDSAEITGDVIIGENCVIASGVKIIGDSHGPIRIGNNVEILENSVLHLLPDNQLIIKDNVTIGPGCIIHGSEIEENTIIESGAIICDYSKVGKNVLIKSGSLVKQRSIIKDNHIIEGYPVKTIGENSDLQKKPSWAYGK